MMLNLENYEATDFDQKKKLKTRKSGKAGQDKLSEKPDYEKADLEKFDQEEFSWGESDDEAKAKSFTKSTKLPENDLKKFKSRKTKDQSNEGNGKNTDCRGSGQDLDDKSKPSNKKGLGAKKSPADDPKGFKSGPEKEEILGGDGTPLKAGLKKSNKEDLPEISDDDRLNLEEYNESPFESVKKPKSKKPKSLGTDDLPDIPDYEKPELEKFEKEEFSWGESDDDVKTKPLGTSTKLSRDEPNKTESRKPKAEPSNIGDKNLNRLNPVEATDESVKTPIKKGLGTKKLPTDEIIESKGTPGNEKTSSESNKPSKIKSKNIEADDFPQTPDDDQSDLEEYQESAEPTKRKKSKKPISTTAEDFPEIPDYEKAALEKFEKEEFSWGESDDDVKTKQIGKDAKPSADLSKKSRTPKPSKEPCTKSEYTDHSLNPSQEAKGKSDIRSNKGLGVKKTTQDNVSKSLKEITDKEETVPEENSPSKVRTKKEKQDDLAQILDDEKPDLEKYQETPCEPPKKIKTKKPKVSAVDDLPEISDYEPPKLEKFNRDEYKLPTSEDNSKTSKRRSNKNGDVAMEPEDSTKGSKLGDHQDKPSPSKIEEPTNKGDKTSETLDSKEAPSNIEEEEFSWGGSDDEIKIKPFGKENNQSRKTSKEEKYGQQKDEFSNEEKPLTPKSPYDDGKPNKVSGTKKVPGKDSKDVKSPASVEEPSNDSLPSSKLKKGKQDISPNISDENKPNLEKLEKTSAESSKKPKTKKPKTSAADDLPEIPDYEPPNLEKFERDDYKLPADDASSKTPKSRGQNKEDVKIKSDEPIRKLEPTKSSNDDGKTEKPSSKFGETQKPSDSTSANPKGEIGKYEQEEFSWGNSDDDVKVKPFGKGAESSSDVNKSSKRDKNDEDSTATESKFLQKATPQGKNEDIPSSNKKHVGENIQEPKISDSDSSVKPKTKKQSKTEKYDLPKIPDYDRPDLEKFDKDDLWNQDVEMKETDLENSSKNNKESPKGNASKNKPINKSDGLTPNTKISQSDDQNSLNKPSDKKNVLSNKPSEDEKSLSLKDGPKSFNNPLAKEDDNKRNPLNKEKLEDLLVIDDDDRPDLEKYKKSDYESSRKLKDKGLDADSKGISNISDYEKPELGKYEKSDYTPDKKLKDGNTKSWSGITKPKGEEEPNGVGLKPFDNKPTSGDINPEKKSNLNGDDFKNDPWDRKSSLKGEISSNPSSQNDEKPNDGPFGRKNEVNPKDVLGRNLEDNPSRKSSIGKDEVNSQKLSPKDERLNPSGYQEGNPSVRKYSFDKSEENPRKSSLTAGREDDSSRRSSKDEKINPFGRQEESPRSRKSSLDKSKEEDATRRSSLKDNNPNQPDRKEDNPWVRKSSLDKSDDNPRKLSLGQPVEENNTRKLSLGETPASPEILDEARAANLRYLQRRLQRQKSKEDSNVTAKLPKAAPSKTSTTSEPASADVLSKYKPSLAEEAASKSIQVKEPRDAPIEIMITEPDSPTDKTPPKAEVPKIISKPGPRNPRYDPLAFVPEDEELPPQTNIPQPTTPTYPSSPAKTKYNPFQYDLDDDETPAEKVNTQTNCATKFIQIVRST